MRHASIDKTDRTLLKEVSLGKLLGIEPREKLRLLLDLQDRGFITMCASGWALTSRGKQLLDALGKPD